MTLNNLPERMRRGEMKPPPIATLIGFRVTAVEPGQVTVAFEAGARHHNPMGTLHGGVFCDVADAAMGMAFATTLAEGESFTTLELKINFLKTIRNEKLIAIGKVVKRGRVVGLTECEIFDQQAQLVAKASSTCMVLRGDTYK